MSPRKLLPLALIAIVVGVGVATWLLRDPREPDARLEVDPHGSRLTDSAGAPRPGREHQTEDEGSEGDDEQPRPADIERRAGDVFARFDWGSGPDQLGRDRPQEANPEAPMSFAAGPDGRVWVLDQVNGRLVRLGPDGEVLGTTRLDQVAPQDVAVGDDGTVAVLDRLADRNVTVLSPDGEVVGTIPLEGDLIPETGGVTAVIIDGDDVYAEREHGPLVHIGDVQGRPATARHEVPGRPSRDQQLYLLAALVDPVAGRFIVNAIERETGRHRFTRQLQAVAMIREILLLDTDGQGVIYVAIAGAPAPDHPEYEEVHLVCLAAADGATIGTAILPGNMGAEETMRQIAVLPGGGVLYGIRTEAGMAFERFDCRGGMAQ